MSESSTQHADVAWPHPGSEAARADGRYVPDPANHHRIGDDPTD